MADAEVRRSGALRFNAPPSLSRPFPAAWTDVREPEGRGEGRGALLEEVRLAPWGACAHARQLHIFFCVVEVRLSVPLQLLRVLECEVRCVAKIAEVLDERVEAARGAPRHPIVALLVSPRARGAWVVTRDPRRVLHPSAANGARHRGSARCFPGRSFGRWS